MLTPAANVSALDAAHPASAANSGVLTSIAGADADAADTRSLKNSRVGGGNSFGIVRFVLAACVIFGHTPELMDGNRLREPLTYVFGVLSLGEVAVDGFFLISGYLLTSSLTNKPGLLPYFIHRVSRIYPGFIVAFIFCVIVVAPLAGSVASPARMLLQNAARLVLLQPPSAEGVFVGAPFPALDGSMWTISYEFGCYILLALLSVSGFLRRPNVIYAGVGFLLVVLLLRLKLNVAAHAMEYGGAPQNVVRFASAFLWGAALRLTLTPARRKLWTAAIAAAVMLLSLGNRWAAEPALIVFGGYALICVAEHHFSRAVSSVGGRVDLSYGIYLYAWPLQNLLIWKLHLASPLAVSVLALAGTLLLGFLSWTLVERPSMRLGRRIVQHAGASG